MFFSEYYSFSLVSVQMLQIVPIKLLLLVTGAMWPGALSKTSVEHSFAEPAELMQFSASLEELLKLYCYYALFCSLPCLHQLHLAHRKIWSRIWQGQRAVEQPAYLLHFLDLGEKLLLELKQSSLMVLPLPGLMASVLTVGTCWQISPCCAGHVASFCTCYSDGTWWPQLQQLCAVMCK